MSFGGIAGSTYGDNLAISRFTVIACDMIKMQIIGQGRCGQSQTKNKNKKDELL